MLVTSAVNERRRHSALINLYSLRSDCRWLGPSMVHLHRLLDRVSWNCYTRFGQPAWAIHRRQVHTRIRSLHRLGGRTRVYRGIGAPGVPRHYGRNVGDNRFRRQADGATNTDSLVDRYNNFWWVGNILAGWTTYGTNM